jgi:hypothetical protein
MPIPHADAAFIPPEKLTDYLLNVRHPIGGSKANWLHGLGYDLAKPAVLEQDLLALVRTTDDYAEKDSPFGTKYVVSGTITTPTGKEVNLTTVWIIDSGNDRPRLVTAYPGEKP